MPRENGGVYRTEAQMSESPSGAPKPSRARAQASEGDSFSVLSAAAMEIIAQVIGEESANAEKRLRTAVVALRDEFEVNAAVIRDELLAKLDARAYGSAILDETSVIAERAVRELRADVAGHDKIVKARLDVVTDRLDAFERESKKRELDQWRGFVAQLARQHGKVTDLEAKLSAALAMIDKLGTELRQLRHDLGDEAAKPWPETLALPAPATA